MRLLAALAILSFAGALHAQAVTPTDEIINQENAFWRAYVAGDTGELSKLLLPDFTSIEEEIQNREQVLSFVKQFFANCTLAPVKLLNPHVSLLTPQIATIVYHATETPTCGARTISGDTNIPTVWLKRDGRWQMHLHTEYAVHPSSNS